MVKENSVIRYENIKKTFSDYLIFNNLNLNIEKSKITTIIGKSGSGKTLLLKILIGLISFDSGNIYFEGKNISRYSEKQFLSVRKKIAILFQNGALFDSLSVSENIAYPLRLHFKMTNGEIQSRIIKNLEMVGLRGIENLMPAELSEGMKKMVSLARALSIKPTVMLYDDPTAGLDPISSNKIKNLILNLKRELDLTSIVVTNDMNTAFEISDKLAMINNKKIMFYGTSEEIKSTENQKVFNFINGIETN